MSWAKSKNQDRKTGRQWIGFPGNSSAEDIDEILYDRKIIRIISNESDDGRSVLKFSNLAASIRTCPEVVDALSRQIGLNKRELVACILRMSEKYQDFDELKKLFGYRVW